MPSSAAAPPKTARTEPACSQYAQQQRENKSTNTPKLQEQVGQNGANQANPVARRAGRRRCGGAVKRWIERRIGREREEKEERGDAHQEADQLVEPTVAGRGEDARKVIHRRIGAERQHSTAGPELRQSHSIMPKKGLRSQLDAGIELVSCHTRS